MEQNETVIALARSAARFVKFAVFSVMALLWVGFWTLIVRLNFRTGNPEGAVVLGTLLLVIPAILVVRRVKQIRAETAS